MAYFRARTWAECIDVNNRGNGRGVSLFLSRRGCLVFTFAATVGGHQRARFVSGGATRAADTEFLTFLAEALIIDLRAAVALERKRKKLAGGR